MSHASFFSPNRATHYDGLYYAHITAGLWRFVVKDEDDADHVVGPYYRTKAELLADMTRYAVCHGFASGG